uniref:Epithelial membrane protein 2 n=1 Tax=Oncorhynchus tshawytscha TaxID=74940 RepID=A0AAZ3Q8E9_ONCTS
MLVILTFILLFHVISVILLFISTINNAWWVASAPGGNVIYTDLWYSCNVTCLPVKNSASTDAVYLQAVQATMILSTILCCVGFFVFILQLFRLKQGERFVFTAIIQLLASEYPILGILNLPIKDSYWLVIPNTWNTKSTNQRQLLASEYPILGILNLPIKDSYWLVSTQYWEY